MISAWVLTACPSKSPKNDGPVKRVKGDPYVFVKNTEMNGNRAIPTELIGDGSLWQLHIKGFVEEEAETDLAEIVQEQDPANRQEEKLYLFSAKVSGNKLTLTSANGNLDLIVSLTRSDSGWLLDAADGIATSTLSTSNYQILHTSFREEAFSLLIHITIPGQRAILSLAFVRNEPKESRIGDTSYEYIRGSGVKVGWSQRKPVVLHICGDLQEHLAIIPQDAVRKWAEHLTGRLDFSTKITKRCPPFSDLNTQTFSFTPDWIEIVGRAGVAGFTTITDGPGSREFLDNDIVILLEEYQEALEIVYGPNHNIHSQETLQSTNTLKRLADTTLHEIGHFLGLHHMFKPGVPSIMSYENSDGTLTEYDINAIQHLYDEIPQG